MAAFYVRWVKKQEAKSLYGIPMEHAVYRRDILCDLAISSS